MIRVIIVDDEILSRIGIQSFIDGKEGIKVSGVYESAEDAIEFLEKNHVDIVITDIEMAQMNGLQFIKIIREKNLADGVIILSCHDDFSYAQEAISMGTDSYMLKYSVTEQKILSEIKKVYKKIQKPNPGTVSQEKSLKKPEDITEKGIFCIGVIHISDRENWKSQKESGLDSLMLTHLLEGIVERYQMGTLFTPYNKKMFIIFRFACGMSTDELEQTLNTNILLIVKNLKQYISTRVVFGISTVFTDLKLAKEKYEEAVEAVQQAFYESTLSFFFYRDISMKIEPLHFSTEKFLAKMGLSVLEQELNVFLRRAHFQKMSVSKLKGQVIQAAMVFAYQIIKEYGFGEKFSHKWNSEARFIELVTASDSEEFFKKRFMEIMGQFREEAMEEAEKDELFGVFAYIEQNLEKKISLSELTECCCMSVPSFSKKFKDRTGMTAVEYINERRVERAKTLMKNRNYALWQVADLTGFSNVNYFVRVFKKVSGQTVSEYRKQYGIDEAE